MTIKFKEPSMEKNQPSATDFRMDRRRFLHLSSLVGVGAASGTTLGLCPGRPWCQHLKRQPPR